SQEPRIEEINAIFEQTEYFEHNMKFVTEEVQMAQHKFDTPIEGRITSLEETLNKFVRESVIKQKESESFIWDIKKGYDRAYKEKALSIKQLEVQDISPKEYKKEEVEVKKAVEELEIQRKVLESYVSSIPFVIRLKKEKERVHFVSGNSLKTEH
nr:hypothetical protein [Tanacetum cinerariifolium]